MYTALLFSVALAGSAAQTAPSEASITKQLQGLRAVPDARRPAVTKQIALDIRTLPAGLPKLKLANGLCSLATEGDAGKETLDAVAETLATALKENPIPPKTPDAQPAQPYMELAKLIRYEHVSATLDDPLMARADAVLAANDADVAKADFTLKDLKGKKVTLSELRGKIVLVNFWATWCPPCRKEMPDLDSIYTHFQSQGLVILSISDEDAFKVGSFLAPANYHPPVLLDPDGKVAKEFHVDGIPKSFVFDREGKLVAQSIDMRTQRQFLNMLARAGLHH
jgi:peroxiredoxin